jgi:hypothetical protein
MTSFLTSTSCSKISSTTYVVRVVSFSSLLCASCFTLPCATANSPIILNVSSYSNTNQCRRIFFWSCIFSISLYDYLCASMVIMDSTGGNILMFSKAFYAFYYASLNLASMVFIYISSIRFVQICFLPSHRFTHSLSNFLIFSTTVIVVLYLSSLSSGGVPGVVRN